ncbi:MAG TPA: GtrA family protein [Candidatus Limnocylindria bacterium]|nr:GtrA family protein [Candidatus Limnocylindria bacterium]
MRQHRRPGVQDLLRSLLRPSRFAIVGVVGIAVNAVALLFFTEALGIHYVLSAILASQVSTLHNFVLSELWVFRGHDSPRHLLFRYLAFNALNVLTLFVRVPVLIVLTEWTGLHYAISNLVAIGLTFGIRYLVADNWIWAGRDARDQLAVGGWFNYSVHDLVQLRSRIALPELAAFNVASEVTPDIVVERRRWFGGWPRRRIEIGQQAGTIAYREQLGALGVAFDVELGTPVRLRANWLLSWSHHVLYTNMVEPLLRFLLVSRGAVLLHAASLDADRGAVLLSAQTDTGKTSTLLRLLMQRSWAFMGDDMAIVFPDGRIKSFPKPMTLSLHTMSAVSDSALPISDRIMLAIRSRVHSKQGRSIGHAIGRMPLPVVSINAVVQLLVPPPKYHVTSLIDCDISDEAPVDAVILMERGKPLTEEPPLDVALDELLANTEDAYTFPPFSRFAPMLEFDGADVEALRIREREILRSAFSSAWRRRLRVSGHSWAQLIPDLLEGRAAVTPPAANGAAPVAQRADGWRGLPAGEAPPAPAKG